MNGEAVPSEEEETETTGNGAYLGIAGVDLDSQTAYQYNMPTGVYVAQVVSGSGSEEAGIVKGDVITAFNDTEITSMAELQELLAECNPGDTVNVSIAQASNNYAITTVQVTLGTQES
jgi:serine protease Do